MICSALGGWGLLLLDKQEWRSRRMYLARFRGILVLNSGWELCGPQAGCNIGAAVVDLKGKVWIFKVFKTKYTPMLLTRINSHWGCSKQTMVVNGSVQIENSQHAVFVRIVPSFADMITFTPIMSYSGSFVHWKLCFFRFENSRFSGNIETKEGENSS